jgi:hydroxymethylpyrimidine/phosphomethylpyrimidine kinase
MMPCVLTIAGSDSGAGAGIQADLKTCAANGCFAATVITCVTAQNTQELKSVFPLPPSFVAEQIDAIFDEFPIGVVKIGMLFNTSIIEVVAQKMRQKPPRFLILDPVLYAESGGTLIENSALESLLHLLFPLATVVTPNLIEASTILKRTVARREQMEDAACNLLKFGSQSVLIKGGHLDRHKGSDLLSMQNGQTFWFQKESIQGCNTHGTGCTYSSAIAAFMAQGLPTVSAISEAKEYIHGALLHSNPRSLNHFWRQGWKP